jgi:CBS domain-containing protein
MPTIYVTASSLPRAPSRTPTAALHRGAEPPIYSFGSILDLKNTFASVSRIWDQRPCKRVGRRLRARGLLGTTDSRIFEEAVQCGRPRSAHRSVADHGRLLPVVDRLRLLGVITKTDFLKAFSAGQRTAGVPYDQIVAREISTVLTSNPKTFTPQSPLQQVLDEMVATRHRSFVVVDGDQLVGVVSREDVIRALRQCASR